MGGDRLLPAPEAAPRTSLPLTAATSVAIAPLRETPLTFKLAKALPQTAPAGRLPRPALPAKKPDTVNRAIAAAPLTPAAGLAAEGALPEGAIAPQVAQIPPPSPQIVPTTPSQVKLERTQPVSLAEIVELAKRKNRDLLQARLTLDRVRAALKEALAARSPVIDASVDYTLNDSARVRLNNVASFIPTNNRTIAQPLDATVGITYNVYNSGSVDANIRAAENSVRAAEADVKRIEQTVTLNAISAYYSLQRADAQVRIQQKTLENSERSLQDTSALEKAGVGTKFDVLQAEVQLANSKQALLDAQAQQLIARRELARQVEFPPTLDPVASDAIEPAADWKLSLEETILLAVKNRSELDVQRLQKEIALDRAKVAEASLGPQVTLFANYDLADDLSVTGGIAMGYRVGASLNWRLYDGGAASARAEQAAADRALAESRFEQAAAQVRFDVEQAYINQRSRRDQIETARKALEQATEALRLARLRLSAGVGTQLEVIRAEDDNTRAANNLLQAVIGYNQSLADLQRAINGL